MNLHNLAPIQPKALIWLFPVGGNGAIIGPHATRGKHLYETTRTLPPPMTNEPPNDNRKYWKPWTTPRTDPKTPICGTIHTTARFPRLATWAWPDDACRQCQRLMATTPLQIATHEQLNARDPWAQVLRENRWNTPDPVSGQ